MKTKLLIFALALMLVCLTACGGMTEGKQSDIVSSNSNTLQNSSKGSNDVANSNSGVSADYSSIISGNSQTTVNPGTSSQSNPTKTASQGTSTVRPNSQSVINSQTKTSNPTKSSSTSIAKDDPFINVPSTGDITDPVTPTQYPLTLKNANISGTTVDSNSSSFSVEGYASGVTGGGMLNESDSNYIKVTNAKEFMTAIARSNLANKSDSGFATRPMVVEVMNDINLGSNEIGASFADAVAGNSAAFNPALKASGVSTVYFSGRQNLTVFSKNGSTIRHACFQIRGYNGAASKNIIIRNLRFEGAWEWDDTGKYDNNDWDIFTVRADKGEVSKIWFDHCTFTKPYDGTVDIKYGATDVTLSWCAFVPHNKNGADFMSMFSELEKNRSSYPNYNAARNSGATVDDMMEFASINKKVHLVGHSDNNAGDENIRVTYCNNYYYNCTERLPRLRLGKAHVYNCIFDATRANNFENSIVSRGISWPTDLSFASNGSLGTNYGKLLLENCFISGINTPLRNNNKKAGEMYIGSCDALYTYYTTENIDRTCKYQDFGVNYNGRYTFLGNSTKNDGNLMSPFPCYPLAFDTDKFKSELNYSYKLYDPMKLYVAQTGNVGSGKMNFTTAQWEKSTYTTADNFSNKITINGINGATANLGASRT